MLGLLSQFTLSLWVNTLSGKLYQHSNKETLNYMRSDLQSGYV